ncbi:MAG: hypothetical protein OEU93_03365 [Rubrivivax sp.]|nr:hypothetical protein [Rubrivivax sp.]MDH5339146.1 hypothetical protein [Rubrivivax sp.]
MRCTDERFAGLVAAVATTLLVAACGAPAPAPAPPAAPPPPAQALPAPSPAAPPRIARSWDEFRRAAALRIVAANPAGVYSGPAPDPLLAIPVLEIELDAEGQVRRITVLRVPTQAKDTTQLAIDAVRRAAPFGPVRQLSRPWKFVEVFLFDDERRFKPRTLDD